MPLYLGDDESPAVGVVAVTQVFTTRSVSSNSVESLPMMTLTAPVTAGRLYRITGSARVGSSLGNDTAEVRIKKTAATGGAAGTGGEDADADRLTVAGGPGSITLRPSAYFFCTASGTVTWDLVLVRTVGTSTVTGAPGNGLPTFAVEDVGRVP